ncbi:MAG: phosphoglucosamine mutase [Candidatus Bipolaricaulota bacterium]|nr:phosphoglucosamine mutase [Candidatus Bipolaricaulota bacterium]
MPKLFGTDGVRGVAGVELTADLAHRLGRAAGTALGARRALLARDTRLSGPELAEACAEGLAAAGVDVHLAGVLPSPAVSHLVRLQGYDLGVVVSASHNPPGDNGIKFYDRGGLKLSPEEEERVEALLDKLPPAGREGRVQPAPGAAEAYAQFLREAASGLSLAGVRIALDCAFGATWEVAPAVFRTLGADPLLLGAEPDGARINATGAAAPGALQALVRERGAELGIAFDGDGDRAMFVAGGGEVVEGDRLLAALAPLLRGWGELRTPAVVFTVLANGGPERYLRTRGFRVVRVPVGDRNVSWAMREGGIELGGEPSGHFVFGRYAPTGDGILTALLVLRALRRAGRSLAELVAPVPLDPQVRADVPVTDREAAYASLRRTVAEAEGLLGPEGRIVVRPSGTQPLIRILAEGPDEELLREAVALVVQALEPFRA